MVDTTKAMERVSQRCGKLAEIDNLSSGILVSQIKSYLIKAAFKKGIPVDIAEEVAARIILLIAMAEPLELEELQK